MRKGGLRKGPGKKCSSGVRGQNKASRNRKRGRILKRDQQPAVGYRNPLKRHTKNKVVRGAPKERTRPVFKNGIRDRDAKQHLLLKKERILNKAIRQSLDLEIAKLIFESSIGLREPSDRILWKCRPPPKRKR
jgi:hypothetical protein